jgi:hypothetical protein
MTRFASGRTSLAALVLASAVALVGAPALALAQGNASAAASGMGDNYTAMARNFNAPAWNPANLGLPGNSRFSIALSPNVALGTGPVTLKDMKDYGGLVVPVSVRNDWLARIADNGGQNIGGEVNVTPLAFSIGSVALSATTTLRADGALPAAVAELLLFGNAGRTGSAQDYQLGDLALDGNVTSTLAGSYGRRFGIVPVGEFSLGVTGKYIVGHGLASMRDNGSNITSNPVAVNLDAPVVLTDTGTFNNGSGFGIDVGAAWKIGNLQAGATIKNVINTFAWNTDRLYYIPVKATFDQNNSDSKVDSILPLSSAPVALQDELTKRVESATAKPSLALGVAWTGLSRLTIAGDIRQRFGDGLELGPKTQIGVGAELRLIPFIPLRAGVTSLTGGMRYSGGFGLEFGVFNLQASASLFDVDGRNDTAGALTISFGGH